MKMNTDAGFTIVEVLTALVLLFLILTPATYVLKKLLTTSDITDKKNANTICINIAEKALFSNTIKPDERELFINGRRYIIKQQLKENRSGLQLYSVTVSRHNRILSELHHVLDRSY